MKVRVSTMGCCGQKREFLTANPSPVTTSQGAEALEQQRPAYEQYRRSVTPAPSAVSLRYVESSPITVEGPATGTQYHFSGARPVQTVDSRDVVALLRTRFFRRT